MTQTLTRRALLQGAAASTLIVSGVMAPRTARAATQLRLAVPDPAESAVGRAASHFAELVSDKTGGAVAIQVFPDGILYGKDQNAAINQMGSGALDGLILASSVYASFEPKMNAISLPYLFSNYDQLKAYLAGAPGQDLLAAVDRLKIKGLGFFLRTFRNVTTRETAITTVEGFKGLNLRTPNNPLFVSLFQALGANPTPMAFSEVYSALQLKAIDGQENPVEVALNNRLYEVQGHLNMTRHLADSFLVGLSSAAWEKIPAEHQAAVQSAATEMIADHDAGEIAQEAAIIDKLHAAGMQVNQLAEGELAKIQAIARGIYPQFEAQITPEFMKKSIDFVAA